ncbi:heat shock protein HspQ [Cerasicoccus maritimus]|uniref:heat shock protein HspQ n=1 Tax=Cerasicoccus maritimus TaxID=490089 RepID=UPI002852D9BA|nr:heat shock protein HspQ [Cerasicoccus maritimus]
MIAPREAFEQGGESKPHFAPGDLVRHRRYGYRGVVVHRDTVCQASEQWYLSNQTQPDREQPWYYVLVDESDQTTYAAQSSLKLDEDTDCIMHPWVNLYFSGFDDGKYERNDKPWDPGIE